MGYIESKGNVSVRKIITVNQVDWTIRLEDVVPLLVCELQEPRTGTDFDKHSCNFRLIGRREDKCLNLFLNLQT